MLFRTGKNWVSELFLRRGWLVKGRRSRRRNGMGSRPAVIASEIQCLEDRTLLSTITVTSTLDTAGAHTGVTLRDAIQAANTDLSVNGSAAGQANTQNLIVFHAGLTSIALTQGQLTISSSMDIQGLDAASTVIYAAQSSRIFNITSTAGNVTLDSLTLENGTSTQSGGAIADASTGNLLVTNSILTGNSTTGEGGAIYGASGSGAVTVTNSSLTTNTAGGNGGAISSRGGALSISNDTLSSNSSVAGSGGAIFAEGGPLSVASSRFYQNLATTGIGGAILTFRNTMVTSSTFSGNSAPIGGGIWCDLGLTVTNSTLSGNIATQNGGAVFAYAGKVAVTNSTISQNQATNTAGGIYVYANKNSIVTLNNSILAGCNRQPGSLGGRLEKMDK